jgi:RNA polymerase sigma-70 factor (ECF subfamily)
MLDPMDNPVVLAVQARAGSLPALDSLLRLLEARLYILIRRIVGDQDRSYDILQEACWDVARGITRLRDPNRVVQWSYRIAFRRAIQARGAGRPVVAAPEPESAQEPGPLDLLIREEDHEELEKILQAMDPGHVAVVHLFYGEGWTTAEIAEALDLPAGTVRSRLHYARRAILHAARRIQKEA